MTPFPDSGLYVNKWLREMEELPGLIGKGRLSVAEVLRELLRHTATALRLPVYVPEVTVLLATGGQVTGVLLAASHTSPDVLVVGVEEVANRNRQVVFVQTSHIIGIAVQNPDRIGRLISGTEIPERLEITRLAGQLGESLGLAITVSVPEQEEGRMVVHALLLLVVTVCQTLQKETSGLPALTDYLQQVHIRPGTWHVELVDKKMDISADIDSFPTADQLVQQIESLL